MSDEEFYVACGQRDFMNWLAFALAQFNFDVASGRPGKPQFVRRARFLRPPIQLCSEPTGKKERSRSESGCKIDAHVTDFGQAMMRSRMIEELCDGEADIVQARPILVAQDQALLRFAMSSFDQRHLRGKIFPVVAVVDESVDPLPELRIHGFAELLLPPEIERQI